MDREIDPNSFTPPPPPTVYIHIHQATDRLHDDYWIEPRVYGQPVFAVFDMFKEPYSHAVNGPSELVKSQKKLDLWPPVWNSSKRK